MNRFRGYLSDISTTTETLVPVYPRFTPKQHLFLNLRCNTNLFLYLHTVGPLIIDSIRVKKRVSTGALGALEDPRVVQTKI